MGSYRKIKDVAKVMIEKSESLTDITLSTMQKISNLVGSTLGPGGCPVLLERQEFGLPNFLTKDGVTVFRGLGFSNPIKQAIMETAREASVRTAQEAGDGTTTATVLSQAFVQHTHSFVKNHPSYSPQKIVRRLNKILKEKIEPLISEMAIHSKGIEDPLLKSVACCSANGDQELADYVVECFRQSGDGGNITISEKSGPCGLEIEKQQGYPISVGYEDSCMRFFPAFINDKANNRVFLEKPIFILNYGIISDITSLAPITEAIIKECSDNKEYSKNIVVVATGFSDSVLAQLTHNWSFPNALRVFPLKIPNTPTINGQMEMLQDLQAITGSTIFDPVSNRSIENAVLEDLGSKLEAFESTRYRSYIFGEADEGLRLAQYETVKQSIAASLSELEKRILEERCAKLSGGIIKLYVIDSSTAAIRERKDRVDDAVCAIRGALKYGALPGAGYGLASIISNLSDSDDIVIKEVLLPALKQPIIKLMENVGLNEEEIEEKYNIILKNVKEKNLVVWDGIEDQMKSCYESGIIDSVPAVLEAIRNSIGIASMLGMLGGVIVFDRDTDLEKKEAMDTYDFLSDSGMKGE